MTSKPNHARGSSPYLSPPALPTGGPPHLRGLWGDTWIRLGYNAGDPWQAPPYEVEPLVNQTSEALSADRCAGHAMRPRCVLGGRHEGSTGDGKVWTSVCGSPACPCLIADAPLPSRDTLLPNCAAQWLCRTYLAQKRRFRSHMLLHGKARGSYQEPGAHRGCFHMPLSSLKRHSKIPGSCAPTLLPTVL